MSTSAPMLDPPVRTRTLSAPPRPWRSRVLAPLMPCCYGVWTAFASGPVLGFLFVEVRHRLSREGHVSLFFEYLLVIISCDLLIPPINITPCSLTVYTFILSSFSGVYARIRAIDDGICLSTTPELVANKSDYHARR